MRYEPIRADIDHAVHKKVRNEIACKKRQSSVLLEIVGGCGKYNFKTKFAQIQHSRHERHNTNC